MALTNADQVNSSIPVTIQSSQPLLSQLQVIDELATNILKQVPAPIDTVMVEQKYPVMYEQSMNTVIIQEIIRYNRLLRVISSSLRDLQKALKGLVVMSQQLEDMSNSLFNNQVPTMWAAKVSSRQHV